MVKTERRRYVLFEANAERSLSRGEMVHTLNILSRELGLDEKERPWLMVFEECQERYLGVFRVPHLGKDAVVDALSGGREVNGVLMCSIKSSGSMRKIKGLLARRSGVPQ